MTTRPPNLDSNSRRKIPGVTLMAVGCAFATDERGVIYQALEDVIMTPEILADRGTPIQ